MVGSGVRHLARYLDACPTEQAPIWRGWNRTEGRSCLGAFRADSLTELHIDPYGNILNNCGMALGHISRTTPARVLAEGPENASRFIGMLCRGGPWSLAEFARREHGFRVPERTRQACELCWLTRRFLRPYHPEAFGPAELYA